MRPICHTTLTSPSPSADFFCLVVVSPSPRPTQSGKTPDPTQDKKLRPPTPLFWARSTSFVKAIGQRKLVEDLQPPKPKEGVPPTITTTTTKAKA